MEVSYEHANPRKGNESFLIRVQEDHEERTLCILVDAGDGVNINSLLDNDEHLVAILLTHAHMDHYRSLASAHQPGVPIFTTPDTAAILGDVLAEGARNFDIQTTDDLLDRVEPVSDWESILGDTISIRPIPVGHALGAGGFLIRVQDGDDTFRILTTGDFTLRDAGGNPGFDPAAYLDVDALFLTAATTEGTDERLTDIVGEVAERTNAGSRTLCTASGLTGVHLAALFAAVDDKLDYSIPTILVGQVAKLYDELGYDHSNVETIPEFADPEMCLEAGAVTIAGPEVPVEGSSGRLFETLRGDANATLVQVQSGATTAKDAGDFAGTVESFEFSNHPSADVLDDVVETISPTHVVIEHQSGRSLKRYKDKWDSFSWATGDSGKEALYRDGTFVPPGWVTDAVKRRVRDRDGQTTVQVDDNVLEAASTFPAVTRRESVSLEAEGIDVRALRERLHIRPTPSAPSSPATTPAASETGASDSRRSLTDGGLHRTVGSDLPVDSTIDFDDGSDTESDPTSLIDTVRPSGVGTREPTSGEHENGDESSTTQEGAVDESKSESKTESEDDTTEEETMSKNTQSVEAHESVPETSTDATESMTFEIDPAVRALTEHHAADSPESLDRFVYDAIESYLTAALRGAEPWSEQKQLINRAVTIDTDAAFEQLLAARADDGRIESFVLETLCEKLGFDYEERRLTVRGLDSLTPLITALTENNDCPYDTCSEVVQAALEDDILRC